MTPLPPPPPALVEAVSTAIWASTWDSRELSHRETVLTIEYLATHQAEALREWVGAWEYTGDFDPGEMVRDAGLAAQLNAAIARAEKAERELSELRDHLGAVINDTCRTLDRVTAQRDAERAEAGNAKAEVVHLRTKRDAALADAARYKAALRHLVSESDDQNGPAWCEAVDVARALCGDMK